MNLRMARGFLWGAVATVAMTLMHFSIWAIEGRLTIDNMATKMMPSNIITKMFGPGLPVSSHLLLAALIHLGYGAFWGAILFALAKRVTFWHGIAMGAFLYLGSHIFLSPLLASRSLAGGSLLSWFSIATHFTYGATLGLLGGGRIAPRLHRRGPRRRPSKLPLRGQLRHVKQTSETPALDWHRGTPERISADTSCANAEPFIA